MTPLAQEVEVTANPVWTPKKAQHFLIISASDHTTNFQGDSESQKEERGGGDGKREYRGVWGQGRGREGKTARKLA